MVNDYIFLLDGFCWFQNDFLGELWVLFGI